MRETSRGRPRARRTPAAAGPAAASRRGPARARRHADQGRPRARDAVPTRPTARGHSLTFTSRAAVLGLALCAVVLTLAYPTKEWLGQRSALASERSQQQQLEAQICSLTAQHAAALTPAQVEAQARARLHYVTPGTRNYIEVVPAAKPPPTATKAGNATVPVDPDGSWFGRLWQSDGTAGS